MFNKVDCCGGLAEVPRRRGTILANEMFWHSANWGWTVALWVKAERWTSWPWLGVRRPARSSLLKQRLWLRWPQTPFRGSTDGRSPERRPATVRATTTTVNLSRPVHSLIMIAIVTKNNNNNISYNNQNDIDSNNYDGENNHNDHINIISAIIMKNRLDFRPICCKMMICVIWTNVCIQSVEIVTSTMSVNVVIMRDARLRYLKSNFIIRQS